MIIGIEGGLGSGKTLLMVRYLLRDHAKGNRVYANFGLRGIDYEPLNVPDLMQNSDISNVSIGLDEITVFLDCRKSGSKVNRLLSYFILQTRKRNVNLYYTTQDFGMVDLRLVNHTHFQIICSDVGVEGVRKYSVIDLRDSHNLVFHRFYLDISRYYEFYDTNEVILPPSFS